MISRKLGIAAVVAAGVAGSAVLATRLFAEGRYYPVTDPVTAKECSACHMLYPAGLLAASSWKRIVDGLANHFGENASVDAATAKKLADYLTANGGSESYGGGASPLRITELGWFQKEHGRRITPASLQRTGAKSAADCLSCHKDGERGNFDDD